MRNFALKAYGRPVEIVCEEEPMPTGSEVLVEVTRCGVCHTDVSIQKGYYDLGGGRRYAMADRGLKLPVVLGHEIAGRLVAKGPQAQIADDQIGRSFVVYPWIGCGACINCASGRENMCLAPRFHGLQRPGGQAERILVPHARYLVDIEGIDPALAATYACSGLTSFSALRKLGPGAAAAPLLLIGAGGLGQSALAIALALGFRRIIVADIDAGKREIARAASAHDTLDPADEAAFASLFGDVAGVVDFVGNTATAELGMKLLARGGAYVLVGLLGGEVMLSLPPIALRPISIMGSLTGTLDELRELIAMAKAGRLPPFEIELLGRDQANVALDRVRTGQVRGRLVLTSGTE